MSATEEILAAARHLVQASGRQPVVQHLGEVGVFSHDVTTMIRTCRGEETLRERETIVFQRDGDRWAAVHEHLSPHPEPAAQSPGTGQP